jgi:hypothetical protein
MSLTYGIIPLRLSTDRNLALIPSQGTGEDIHQCRFAGSIMSDQTDAFPCPNRKINSCQCSNGAEAFFGAVQSNNDVRKFVHDTKDPQAIHTLGPARRT